MSDATKMQLEANEHFVKADDTIGPHILITPPIDENYWLLRVPLSDSQALICFPKFTTYGIGFQHEEDWNTNLPYRVDADEIYNHIEHNKGDANITRAQCIKAIGMIQHAIARYDTRRQKAA